METKDNGTSRILKHVTAHGLIRSSEATELGATRSLLTQLVEQELLVRVARGLYISTDLDLSSHLSLVIAQHLVPSGTICLLSALEFHGLTTQIPHEVWIAIPNKGWRSRLDYPPMRFVFTDTLCSKGDVERYEIDGHRVRVTTPARTVADCFKYRNKIGLDVALEALRDFNRKKPETRDALWRAAKAARVSRVMLPYLEASSA